MTHRTSSWLSLALPAWLAACGGGADDPPVPDAAPEDRFRCEPRGAGDVEPFELKIGLRSEESFEEVLDDDECPVVLGPQGLYMFQGELRTSLSVPTDSICFDCVAEVSEFGSFQGITQPGFIDFTSSGATFSAFLTIILAAGAEGGAALDGADVDLSISCDGHGFTGTVTRSVHLFLME